MVICFLWFVFPSQRNSEMPKKMIHAAFRERENGFVGSQDGLEDQQSRPS